MDVAFVIPNSGQGFIQREFKFAGESRPASPYTLAEILGVLEEHEPEVGLHVVDAQIEHWSPAEAESKLDEIDPDLVVGLLSCFHIPEDREYVELPYPTIGIITPCSVDAAEADRIYDLDIDYFTRMEVETTILEAVREFDETGDIVESNGLYRRTGDGLVGTGPPEQWSREHPMPAFERAGFDRYYEAMQIDLGDEARVLLNTMKGCPFECTFCCEANTDFLNIKSADQVLAEVERIRELTGCQTFQFIDDEFGIRLSRAKDLCRSLRDLEYDVQFEAMNRVEFVDEELIRLAEEAGCYLMSFGIESGDQRVQEAIDKNLDFEHAKEAFGYLGETDIDTRAFTIVGLPGEREETLDKTKSLLRELDPDLITTGVCYPSPCTPMYNRLKAEGKLLDERWHIYRNKEALVFEHDYYDSMAEVKERVDDLNNWWLRYRVGRQLRTTPHSPATVEALISYLGTFPALRSAVSDSRVLSSAHHFVRDRIAKPAGKPN